MAPLEIFAGWVPPCHSALLRSDPESQILPLVCNFYVVPIRDGSLEALLNKSKVIMEWGDEVAFVES